MLPKDHAISSLRGKVYKPRGKAMVVMNNQGIFFLFDGDPYYCGIRPLSEVLPKYDVVWNEE